MTNCTSEILTGGGVKVGQVKSVVIKKFFSRGVMLQFAPIKFWLGGLFWSSQIYSWKKLPLVKEV